MNTEITFVDGFLRFWASYGLPWMAVFGFICGQLLSTFLWELLKAFVKEMMR